MAWDNLQLDILLDLCDERLDRHDLDGQGMTVSRHRIPDTGWHAGILAAAEAAPDSYVEVQDMAARTGTTVEAVSRALKASGWYANTRWSGSRLEVVYARTEAPVPTPAVVRRKAQQAELRRRLAAGQSKAAAARDMGLATRTVFNWLGGAE